MVISYIRRQHASGKIERTVQIRRTLAMNAVLYGLIFLIYYIRSNL